jgi:biopolymer transport protein ExbD
MTPMIDMTFQLIIFLMLMVNFSSINQEVLVKLPGSELAVPPKQPLEKPITLNVLKDGSVMVAGDPYSLDGLRGVLIRESDAIKAELKKVSDANIIIRGHGDAPVGKVQEVIKVCQEVGFEKFALRAKEEVKP